MITPEHVLTAVGGVGVLVSTLVVLAWRASERIAKIDAKVDMLVTAVRDMRAEVADLKQKPVQKVAKRRR